MINIVMTFAQLERETIVERVTDNYYFRANNGYWAGGYAPYGYKIKHIIGTDGKKHSVLEADEEKSKIVKEIFDMYVNKNISMRKISQDLNVRKVPTLKKGDYHWGICAVNAILSRPIYTEATAKVYDYFNKLGTHITNDIEQFDGSMTANLYGKAKKNVKVKALREYEDMYLSLINCSPLISNEDWFKAQQIKVKRKSMSPRSGTSKRSFLCGLVKCGKCGSNFVTQSCVNRSGIKYTYLICTTKRNISTSVCNNKMIEVTKLQDFVLKDMKEYFNSSNINSKIKKHINIKKKINSKTILQKEEYENELTKCDIQIENLINSIAEGNAVVSKYLNQKIEEIEKQKEEISSKLKDIKKNDNFDNDDYLIDYIKNINDKLDSTDFEELKNICKTVIDKIVITDKNIDIRYKI